MNDSQAAENYCFQRSWRLNSRRKDSRWLIGLALAQLPDRPPHDFQERYREWHDRLDTNLSAEVRHNCGNPLVAWMLLNIILPIVIKLVLEWWSNRKEQSP
jgi:hypothetical protein